MVRLHTDYKTVSFGLSYSADSGLEDEGHNMIEGSFLFWTIEFVWANPITKWRLKRYEDKFICPGCKQELYESELVLIDEDDEYGPECCPDPKCGEEIR